MPPRKRIANAKLPKVEGRGLVREVFGLWLEIVRAPRERAAEPRMWLQAAEKLRRRSVLSVHKTATREGARRGVLLRRGPAGTEVWLGTLHDCSTFRDMHEAERKYSDHFYASRCKNIKKSNKFS